MKNANFMASLKAFFSKAWTATKAFSIKAGKWIVANKLISIPVAVVLVGGIACAIALPIALHEHDFATEWSTDANNHWHSAICSHEEEKSDLGAHAYDNACDTTCNVCGAIRTVGAHVYDNDCDTTCNTCGAIRTVGAHAYDNDCDTTCNTCGATRMVGAHVYDNACDTTCNNCGATRAITHDHADTLTAGDTTHYYLCSVCGDKKDEVAHVFDKTVASSEYLKAAATATTKAQYYKSCVCGKASATEYFETDKTTGTLANIQDLSKTYDKVELANPTYETNSDGAVTIEWYQGNTKLDAKPVNAGTYKVKVIIAESATYTGISAEKEFTIAEKVLSNLSFEFVYRGEANFDTDYLTEAQGILAADVADGIFIFVQFDSKNVGATVTDKEIDFGEEADSYENYEIDMATFTASIVPKTLNYLEITKVYDGKRGFGENAGIYCQLGVDHGVIAGDTVFLETCDDIEYNVGTYTLTRANSGETNDTVWLYGADADNYDFQGDANDYAFVVGEITVTPKTLNYLEITKVYDGEGVLAYALGTEHGVVEGDTVLFYCDEVPDYIVGTYNLIPYDDPTTIDDAGADDRALLAGADKANYKFAERIEGKYKLCATITVTPKTINVTAEFEYSGSSGRQIHAPAPSLSDVIDGDEVYIEIAFDKADVGATVLTGVDAPYLDGADCDNYTLGTYSFSIVPKKLTLKAGETIEVTETYNGQKQYAFSVNSNRFDGYVDTEDASLMLTATLPSKNAGEYTDGVILTPYVGNSAFGTVSHNYDFSEVAATVTIKPLTVSLSSYVKVEYNGTSEFTLATPFDLTSANTGGVQDSVSDNDEVYITWIETSDADITDETFAIDYTLGGADAGNYDIDELGVEITKKKLTNLHLYITSDTYESGEITLLEKDGVVAGEVVKISITNLNYQDFGAGFDIFMELEDGTSPDAYRYETIALVPSGDYANYELATYDDGSGNQVVGIVEGVA